VPIELLTIPRTWTLIICPGTPVGSTYQTCLARVRVRLEIKHGSSSGDRIAFRIGRPEHNELRLEIDSGLGRT
jgi:hypothetical protein